MVPRLAELESRLITIDGFRYDAATSSEVDHEVLVEGCVRGSPSVRGVDEKFAAVTGIAPKPEWDADAQRLELEAALRASWFFNRKSATLGENTYYLSYSRVRDDERVNETWRKIASKWPDPVRTPPVIDDRRELTPEQTVAVYRHAYGILKRREPPEFLSEAVPTSVGRVEGVRVECARSGVAERMLTIWNERELEQESRWDFFRRQAVDPIRISSLPSLAHSRFWAHGGASGVQGAPIEMRYKRNVLEVLSPREDASKPLSSVVDFLNSARRSADLDVFGEFGPYMPVLANFNLRGQFVRLRFLREEVEFAMYVTLRVEYEVASNTASEASSQGLLGAAAAVLARRGFRIERATNILIESTSTIEHGRFELIGRASSDAGLRFCERLRGIGWNPSSQGTSEESAITAELRKIRLNGNQVRFEPPPKLRCGFVEPDR